ncbi:MAG: 4-(cytidine 5'-diphospho)-2-C-methyl-D-erythritol kinase [Phycisphaeraceae bacterium]|nr:4-(cytidine 5'-diphospho)-2-C-methyl-D-erythritol kinase [Phycisphaeraceae bacterium]
MTTKPQFETTDCGLLVRAPAKINLSLLIAGKRDDGFHNIETIMAKVDYFDELLIKKSSGSGIQLTCNGPQWAPQGPENLVFKAAKLLCEDCSVSPSLELTLTKNIPAGTGLGSGSSDAAATLLGINRLLDLRLPKTRLASLAARLGSDIAFFIYGPLSYCTGKGELIDELHTSFDFTALLILPSISVSTPMVYNAYSHNPDIYTQLHREINAHIKENRIDFVANMCANMLSNSCFSMERGLTEAKERFEHRGIDNICLSGSGSAMYCILDPATSETRLDSLGNIISQETGYRSVIIHSIRW